MLDHAKRYVFDYGFSVIGCMGKEPIGPWKEYQERKPTEGELHHWFARLGIAQTIGVVCGRISNLVCLDCDSKEVGRDIFKRFRDMISVIVETRRGVHFAFRHPGVTVPNAVKNSLGADVRGDGGYVIWPCSQVSGHTYKFVEGFGLERIHEMSTFPVEWIERKEIKQQSINESDPVRRIIRARAWVLMRERKEDGNGRGLQTIKTCRALFQMFGLTEEQVWPLILEYNERCCIPPYTERQLRHKIEDAQKGT